MDLLHPMTPWHNFLGKISDISMRQLYCDFLIIAIILRLSFFKCSQFNDGNGDIANDDKSVKVEDIDEYIVPSELDFKAVSLFNYLKPPRIMENPENLIEGHDDFDEDLPEEIVEETDIGGIFKAGTGNELDNSLYGSLMDCTTTEGSSLRASVFSHQSRKLSLGSSTSDMLRSRLDSLCYDLGYDEITESVEVVPDVGSSENAAMDRSNFSNGAIYSEIISEWSEAEEEETDCFDHRQVHNVSLDWVLTVFIPYLLSDKPLLPKTINEVIRDPMRRHLLLLDFVSYL